MRTLSVLCLVVSSLVMSSPSYAEEFRVAAGSSSGTYQRMLAEVKRFCATPDFEITEVPSHGAIENLNLLLDNQATAAMLHADVIFYRNGSEQNLGDRVRTVIALYPEDVHFLVQSQPLKVGGWHGIGQKDLVLNSVADLKGLRVGAAGGGTITAQVINAKAFIGYEFVPFDTGDQVLSALNAGDIQAAVFVGGSPLPNLAKLGKDYRLLPVNSDIADRMKDVYKRSTVTYTGMGMNSVPTVAVDALLVSRVYKTPKMQGLIAKFRACFVASLDSLKEETGLHPKWQSVEAENHGPWVWYDLPVVSPTLSK